MTKQNEMPERIWAMSDRVQKTEKGTWDTVEDDPNFSNIPYSKYLRADTVVSREQYDKLLAAARDMEKALVGAEYALDRAILFKHPSSSQKEVEESALNETRKARAAFEQLEKEGV